MTAYTLHNASVATSDRPDSIVASNHATLSRNAFTKGAVDTLANITFHHVHAAFNLTPQHHDIQTQLKLMVQNRMMTSPVAWSHAVLISPLVLCFAFECVSALASPPHFVLISLGH